MRPCVRVGLDVTWRCNWRCRHCFYLRNPKFHSGEDVPLGNVIAKLDRAKAGGLTQAVLVGYGEPSLCGTLLEILAACHERGMATSMITNGATGLRVFENCFAMGMDHLHVSSHGMGATLDEVARRPGAYARQRELKEWMLAEDLPYRSNFSVQLRNYEQLPEQVDEEARYGTRHFVVLGFLPHYEWGHGHAQEVAVHPAALRPWIEAAARKLVASRIPFTVRYHPLCHLAPEFWPYVVNARYVYFDPWEWNYELQVKDADALWAASQRIGDSVACAQPCGECLARRHCGGWNRVYAAAFDGGNLTAIREVPGEYADVWERDGGLHDMNPANGMDGILRARGRDAHRPARACRSAVA